MSDNNKDKKIGHVAIIGIDGVGKQPLTQFLNSGHLHCSIEIKSAHSEEGELFQLIKPSERASILEHAIHDAEWRIGSYICIEGRSREDAYVQKQIKLIEMWQAEWQKLNSLDRKEDVEETTEDVFTNTLNALEGKARHEVSDEFEKMDEHYAECDYKTFNKNDPFAPRGGKCINCYRKLTCLSVMRREVSQQ